MALSYNISVPIFGGFAPLISTGLIELTGNNLAPSFYLMATALVSFCVLLIVRG
jgi:MHS family proline/betaine transporter-like MFS transporter